MSAEDYSEAPLAFPPVPGAAGERLDKHLAQRLATVMQGVSRSRVQEWIALGAVEVDGVPKSAKARLNGTETLTVRPLPLDAEQAFAPDPVEFPVLHADDDLAVVDKPPGLVVHPAPGNWRGTLMNGLMHRWPEAARLPRAGIVHRLDKDTSGLMVVARSERALPDLVAQLAARSMGRQYLALAEGGMRAGHTVNAPIGRDPADRLRMAADAPHAKPACTHFVPLAVGEIDEIPVTLLLCRLETGRTHQIRVHLKHLGFPLVADPVYGRRLSRTEAIGRQALHAWRLALSHPDGSGRASWTGGLPDDLRAALVTAGIDADAALARAA